MKKYVPIDKMSKKARKELMSEKRVVWDIDPKTKVVLDTYKKRKSELKYEDYGSDN